MLFYLLFLSFIQIMALNNLIANNGKFSYGLKLKEIINIIKDVGYLQYIGTYNICGNYWVYN